MPRKHAEHLKHLARSIERWDLQGKECSDADVAGAYASDVKDLRRVHSAIANDEIDEAAKVAFGLDTIVRGQIPQSVYRFLQDETGA
jgi:Asp-tRNA(Asn)/Glu-tRNA(Gln) amidotransferase A subunit family amidase